PAQGSRGLVSDPDRVVLAEASDLRGVSQRRAVRAGRVRRRRGRATLLRRDGRGAHAGSGRIARGRAAEPAPLRRRRAVGVRARAPGLGARANAAARAAGPLPGARLVSEARLSRGFPPIAGAGAHILILGSLPGKKSLEMGQYYAQPYNAFWRIMGDLFGAGPALAYPARIERLVACGIAVWDVLAAGERPGSLDSAIVSSSIVINDFVPFFARHRENALVCCNGQKAAALYRRHVLPILP